MSDSAAGPSASSSGGAASELAAQAEAGLQQLLSQMLQQSQAAGDATAELSRRIQRQQSASVASATAATCRIFEIADQQRRIVLRDVAQLNDLEPLHPEPVPFGQAVGELNTRLLDPLLAPPKSSEEIARELVADYRVAQEIPRFPLPLPTVPDHDRSPAS